MSDLIIESGISYAKYKPDLDFRLKLEIDCGEGKSDIIIADEYGNLSKGLDMDFHIVKSFEPKPKESKLTIYNLNIDTYNKIYQNANAFRLSCARGKDVDYTPFYTGYPVRSVRVAKQTVLTSNQGFMSQDANAGRRGQSDLETEISLMSYGFGKLYKSYREPVSTEIIINDCIEAMGLPKGNIDEIEHRTMKAGYTIRGNVSTTLDELGKLLGFYWNNNDMQFNLYDKTCNTYKPYGIILNGNNSATPERQDDKFSKKKTTKTKASQASVKDYKISRLKQGFMIETMLLPFLQVGSTCRLDFPMADAQGDKYIYKIIHKGNNYGTQAVTQVFCL